MLIDPIHRLHSSLHKHTVVLLYPVILNNCKLTILQITMKTDENEPYSFHKLLLKHSNDPFFYFILFFMFEQLMFAKSHRFVTFAPPVRLLFYHLKIIIFKNNRSLITHKQKQLLISGNS